jgi:hypothetical protein
MPSEHLSELSAEQKKKIEDLIRKNKKLEYSEITALMMEASKEYQLTMNNIIFDLHMEKQPEEMVPHHLVLPASPIRKPASYFGLLELERNKGAKEVIRLFFI